MATPDWFKPPDDTPDFMYPAWAACLRWAVGHTDILNQFEEKTGVKYIGPRTPLDQIIDQATGHDPAERFMRSFVPWFNVSIWGSMDGEVDM